MNKAIIENFNQVVDRNDDLYLLGDIFLGGPNSIDAGIDLFNQLRGKIHLVWGNHDTDNRKLALSKCPNVVEICGYATMLKYNKYNFYLNHYPTATFNYDIDKPLRARILCLAGHTHSKDLFDSCGSYNVAVDAHDCYPISLDEIINDFKNKELGQK